MPNQEEEEEELLYSSIPRKNLQARGAVHYQHQNPLDNQKTNKYYKCVHQYQSDKKARMKQTNKQKNKKTK